MHKRGTSPLAIVILTFFIVGLFGYAWLTFQSKGINTEVAVYNPSLLHHVYGEETTVAFYINHTMNGAIINLDKKNIKKSFITHFKKILARYRYHQGNYIVPELSQVNEQLTSNHISLDGNKLTFFVIITVTQSVKQQGISMISATDTKRMIFTKVYK